MTEKEKKLVDAIGKVKDHAELLDLWNRHKENKLTAEEDALWKKGKLLEYVVLRAFELEDAQVTWPYSINLGDGSGTLEQIDGAFFIDGYHVLTECKDYATNINIEPFSKMRNQLLRRPSFAIGCIFVRNGFTEPAIALSRFCAPQTILLWSGAELEYCIENNKMVEAFKLKIRKAVEEFEFNYNVKAYFDRPKI